MYENSSTGHCSPRLRKIFSGWHDRALGAQRHMVLCRDRVLAKPKGFLVVTEHFYVATEFGHGERICVATGFSSSQQSLTKEGDSMSRQGIRCRDRERAAG